MKRSIVIAIIFAATTLAGCSFYKEGTSLSETKWVDNNCTGNGMLKNPDWCSEHASMGPYAAQ